MEAGTAQLVQELGWMTKVSMLNTWKEGQEISFYDIKPNSGAHSPPTEWVLVGWGGGCFLEVKGQEHDAEPLTPI
jgi:hypothetical protein